MTVSHFVRTASEFIYMYIYGHFKYVRWTKLQAPLYYAPRDTSFRIIVQPFWLHSSPKTGNQSLNKMATFNGKSHVESYKEYGRDGKPCRACTDLKTWLKMTRKDAESKEVPVVDRLL